MVFRILDPDSNSFGTIHRTKLNLPFPAGAIFCFDYDVCFKQLNFNGSMIVYSTGSKMCRHNNRADYAIFLASTPTKLQSILKPNSNTHLAPKTHCSHYTHTIHQPIRRKPNEIETKTHALYTNTKYIYMYSACKLRRLRFMHARNARRASTRTHIWFRFRCVIFARSARVRETCNV